MSEPFVGEIKMFAGSFAPRGWALCDGQLLSASQNDALFSLLGTIYGGDGTTFGLPGLRGRIPIHAGSGPGLTPRALGARGGAERVTVTTNQLASHTHSLMGSSAVANEANPDGNVLAEASTFDPYQSDPPTAAMSGDAVTNVGGSQNHTNLMPFLCVNFIIALVGIYPSRT